MEKRFERKAEAGGEKGQELSDKRTWRERFFDRFKNRSEKPATDEQPAEKHVSFVDFMKGMFSDADNEPQADARSRNWIDRAWDEREETPEATVEQSGAEKLAELPEREQTEFFMVVAQRFKDAGERFVGFIRRSTASEMPQGAETPEGIQIQNVEAMYMDDRQNEGRDVPKVYPPELVEDAPPFDFAVTNREPEPTDQEKRHFSRVFRRSSEEPLPATERGAIDDFDFTPSERSEDATHTRVTQQGDMTRLEYRPRVRDVLFASAVGTAYGRRESRKIRRELEQKQKRSQNIMQSEMDDQAKELQEAQTRLRKKQQRMERDLQSLKQHEQETDLREQAVDVIEREIETREKVVEQIEKVQEQTTLHDTGTTPPQTATPEAFQKIQEAAKELLKPVEQQIPTELQADPTAAAQRLAAAEAESITELEFKNLKPASERIEQTTPEPIARPIQTNPDDAAVRSIRSESVKGSETIANPFEKEIRRRQQMEVAKQALQNIEEEPKPEIFPPQFTPEIKEKPQKLTTPAIANDQADPVSVQEILANRVTSQEPKQSLREQITDQYNVDTSRGTQNWIATGVIIALILIGLLFITAI